MLCVTVKFLGHGLCVCYSPAALYRDGVGARPGGWLGFEKYRINESLGIIDDVICILPDRGEQPCCLGVPPEKGGFNCVVSKTFIFSITGILIHTKQFLVCESPTTEERLDVEITAVMRYRYSGGPYQIGPVTVSKIR